MQLIAGDRRLTHSVETGALNDPDFIKPYLEQAKPIKLGESEKQTVDLKLIAAEDKQ